MFSLATVAGLLVVLLISYAVGWHVGRHTARRILPLQQAWLPPVVGFARRIENLPYVVLAALCLVSVIARLVLILR